MHTSGEEHARQTSTKALTWDASDKSEESKEAKVAGEKEVRWKGTGDGSEKQQGANTSMTGDTRLSL